MRPPTPQTLDFGGGFWILGILDFGLRGFWILGFWGFWILESLDFGFWGRNPNPKSKIPNPNFFGQILGILDFGSLCSNSLCEAPTPHILDFGGDFGFWGFWILGILDFGEFGFWILGPESQIQNPKSPIQTFLAKFWGFWILDRYVAILYVRPQRPIFWILAGILDFGDFGFWGFWGFGILDFGDFGFWDFGDFGFLGFWGFWILAFWNIM